jgi:hypothetical protein
LKFEIVATTSNTFLILMLGCVGVELENSTYCLGKTSTNFKKFMNKLIQTIALGTVVLSPLSLIGTVIAADAHHSSSHVSTVATAVAKTDKTKAKKGKKTTAPGSMKKPATPDATKPGATAPAGDTMPATTTPGSSTVPGSKTNSTGDTDGSTSKPGNLKVPTTPGSTTLPGTPTSIPGSDSKPADANTTPNVPTGTPK